MIGITSEDVGVVRLVHSEISDEDGFYEVSKVEKIRSNILFVSEDVKVGGDLCTNPLSKDVKIKLNWFLSVIKIIKVVKH